MDELSEQLESAKDKVMASAARARDHTCVCAEMINKIWRVYRETTERTLDVASHKVNRSETL